MAQSQALSLVLLAEQFEKLPGIGKKQANRLAFHIVNMPAGQADEFVKAIQDARKLIHYCPVCQNLTDKDLCPICGNNSRDKSLICVVESPKDITAFEKSGEFSGVYHVLHGLLSPLDGVGPDDIKIKELLQRVKKDEVKEIVMALDSNVSGETTSLYIARLLKPLGIRVTQLATGIPSGGAVEYTDGVTLANAFKFRNEI